MSMQNTYDSHHHRLLFNFELNLVMSRSYKVVHSISFLVVKSSITLYSHVFISVKCHWYLSLSTESLRKIRSLNLSVSERVDLQLEFPTACIQRPSMFIEPYPQSLASRNFYDVVKFIEGFLSPDHTEMLTDGQFCMITRSIIEHFKDQIQGERVHEVLEK